MRGGNMKPERGMIEVTKDSVFCTNCDKLTYKKYPPIGENKYFCSVICFSEWCTKQRPKRKW